MNAYLTVVRMLSVMIALGSLCGCGALDVVNAVSPDGSYRVNEDIRYGDHVRQRLDWLHTVEEKRGTVVFFYGGGWDSGNRKDYRWVVNPFAEAGFDVVIPDYRLFPEIRFPVFVEDGATALAYVLENAEGPVFLVGHSAGAHIAGLLAYDENYLAEHGKSPEQLSAFVGLAGPYDFLPLVNPKLRTIFPKEDRPDSQPINFVDGTEPPALLLHGSKDETVWPRNSRNLAAEVNRKGGSATFTDVPGIGHIRIVLALSGRFEGVAPVSRYVLSFLDSHLPAETQ